jgi:hypothetical protein
VLLPVLSGHSIVFPLRLRPSAGNPSPHPSRRVGSHKGIPAYLLLAASCVAAAVPLFVSFEVRGIDSL